MGGFGRRFPIVQSNLLTPNDFPDLNSFAERRPEFHYYRKATAKPFERKFTRPHLSELQANGRVGSLFIRVIDADQEQPLELPASAVAPLMDILEAMAAGRGVSIIPENAESTTV